MTSLKGLISTPPLKWENVDSYIDGKVYKKGSQPKVDEYTIRWNTVVDVCTDTARDTYTGPYPHYLYPESVVMVRNNRLIYIDIAQVVTEDINQNLMINFFEKDTPTGMIVYLTPYTGKR